MPFQNVGHIERVRLRQGEWGFNLADSLSSATMDAQIEQVTQATFEVDDPNFEILLKSRLKVGADVDVMGQQLAIAVIETGPGGGEGGFTIECRPRLVRKLKERKGVSVMRNLSPTDYIRREVAAVGGRVFAQDSPNRSNIARDVKQKGDPSSDENSAWTTFQRLAQELAYVMFEQAGTIFFGQPTWLAKHNTVVNADWNINKNKRGKNHLTEFPVLRETVDNVGILRGQVEATLTLPLEIAEYYRPGYGLNLRGMPRYSGRYLITGVNYPLIGTASEVTVTAVTPKNDIPQRKTE